MVSIIEFRESFRSCPIPSPALNTSCRQQPFPKMGASALKRSGSLSSESSATSSSSGIGTGSSSSDGPMSSTGVDSVLDLRPHSLESVIF